VQEETLRFLKQIGEAIISGMLENLLNTYEGNTKICYIFHPELIIKDLILLKSEYPMIFELMNEIHMDLSSKHRNFIKKIGLPPLKPNFTFNDYYLNVIIGIGFGMFNTYMIEPKITKFVFSLIFMRINGKIQKKQIFYGLNFVIPSILENLIFYESFDFKECLISSMILWNYTNFLLNSLNEINYLIKLWNKQKEHSELEASYELLLIESLRVFSGLFKNAPKEKLLVLQALEIDSKLAFLYKEHMCCIYEKRAKIQGINIKMETLATKYYFQQHLIDLLEFPEQFQSKAFSSKKDFKTHYLLEKKKEEIKNCSFYQIQGKGQSKFHFLNIVITGYFFDDVNFVFNEILDKFHKNQTPRSFSYCLDKLFAMQTLKTKKDENLFKCWNQLPDFYKSYSQITFYRKISLPSFLKNLSYICHDVVCGLAQEKRKEPQSLEEFCAEINKENIKDTDLIEKPSEIEEENPEILHLIESSENNKEIEEKKEEIIIGNKDIFLSENDYKFLEKYYCLLKIDKLLFLSLSQSKRIALLQQKYSEYTSLLSDKYMKKDQFSRNLKDEREGMCFLMCEQYLNSQEDQYMYHELQELKFFIHSIIKAQIQYAKVPNDEMFEQSQDLINNNGNIFPLDLDIPLQKFINFNLNKAKGKKTYEIIDEEFLTNNDKNMKFQTENTSKFYCPPKEFDKIYEFSFFSETFEIEEEVLQKIFELLSFSVPTREEFKGSEKNIKKMNCKIRSTYFLIKTLCFNYKNFIRITQCLNIFLEEGNYENNINIISNFLSDSASFSNGEKFKNKEEFFEMMHSLISLILINLIKNNYATNFFVSMNSDSKKLINYAFLINEFGMKFHKDCLKNGFILKKIFSCFQKKMLDGKYDFYLPLLDELLSKSIDKLRIPNENPLFFFPFYVIENNLDFPNSGETLKSLLLSEKCYKNIFKHHFSILENSKNSDSFINTLNSLDCVSFFNSVMMNFQNINEFLALKKQKLMNQRKHKTLDSDSISQIFEEIKNILDDFIFNRDKFNIFCLKVLKFARSTLHNKAEQLKFDYKKSTQGHDEIKKCQHCFHLFEKNIITSIRTFFLENQKFIHSFLDLIKIFLTVENIIGLYIKPQINEFRKLSIFELYDFLNPILKTFFDVIGFVELRELERNHPEELDFLMDDLNLPVLKSIESKKSNESQEETQDGNFEKILENFSQKEEIKFEEVYDFIYKVQISLQYIISFTPNGKSPMVFKPLFLKKKLRKISLDLKMEYIR